MAQIRPSRQLRLLLVPLSIVLSLAAVLAGIEITVRLVPPRATFAAWREASLTYLDDADADWRLEPRSYPWGQVNRYGFRGKDSPLEKRAGTCRVVVVGGSAAFDLWKRDGETWSDQLQERLARSLPCSVEVLNTGTPGYSTWQAVRLVESRLLRWQPDLVLVYELYNDSITFRHGDRQKIIDGWKLNGRANAIGWAAHPDPLLDGLSKVFPRAIDFLRMRLVKVASERRLTENARFWWDPSLSGQVQPQALAFYEENLTRMAHSLIASGNIPLGIITQATLIRESNTDEERRQIHYVYRGLDHAQLWAAYQAAWEINRKVARSEPNVFLIEAQRRVPATLAFFHDEVHLNPEGSRLLAQVIAEGVLERFDPARARPEPPLDGHSLSPLRCVAGGPPSPAPD